MSNDPLNNKDNLENNAESDATSSGWRTSHKFYRQGKGEKTDGTQTPASLLFNAALAAVPDTRDNDTDETFVEENPDHSKNEQGLKLDNEQFDRVNAEIIDAELQYEFFWNENEDTEEVDPDNKIALITPSELIAPVRMDDDSQQTEVQQTIKKIKNSSVYVSSDYVTELIRLSRHARQTQKESRKNERSALNAAIRLLTTRRK